MFTRHLLKYAHLMVQFLLRLALRTLLQSLSTVHATELVSLLELTEMASNLYQCMVSLIRLIGQIRRFYQLLSIGELNFGNSKLILC